jgi:hypothetical protein
MNSFSTHLRGKRFTLMFDHKSLVALGKNYARTLNRLQEVMHEFAFKIIYKESKEIPADFSSRNGISTITFEGLELKTEKDQDPFNNALKAYLLHKELPEHPQNDKLEQYFGPECCLKDDILWKRIKRIYDKSRVVIFLQNKLNSKVHGEMMSGHEKNLVTLATLLTPLPLPTEPNMRVLCDLYGPSKTSGNGKKLILE